MAQQMRYADSGSPRRLDVCLQHLVKRLSMGRSDLPRNRINSGGHEAVVTSETTALS